MPALTAGRIRHTVSFSLVHPEGSAAEADFLAGTYDALLTALADLPLMYLHVIDTTTHTGYPVLEQARERWPGTLMGNEGFTEEWDVAGADRLVTDGKLDLVAYGRRFLANPDLPARLREGAELNEPDPDTFYGGGATGYTDYPTLDELRVRKAA